MITLDTVFTETLLDKNNERVTDINAGLKKFYPQMIYAVTHNADAGEPYLADDQISHYPDLAAYTLYGTNTALYWFLFSNFIENPFEEVKTNWAYYLYPSSVQTEAQTTAIVSSKNTRYGAVVTLN